MNKSAEAFRTIGEVAEELEIPKHVLRFWEGRFPQIRPMKRGGGRRYYRPEDMELLRGIRALLHAEGYTIRGVQKILREHGVDQVKAAACRKPEAEDAVLDDAAAPAKRKRGRKPIAKATTAIAVAPPTKPVAAKVEPRAPNVHVLAAIRELQIARAILQGQALTPASATAATEPKKARAGRS